MLLALSLLLNPAAAATLSVCSSGCDHSDLDVAVEAAADGDVLQLERKTWSIGAAIELYKSLTLQPLPDTSGQLTFELGANAFTGFVAWDGSVVTVEEATITKAARSEARSAFEAEHGTLVLTEVEVKDQVFAAGVIEMLEATARINRCRFKRNETGAGVVVLNQSTATITASGIVGNSASGKSATRWHADDGQVAGGITVRGASEAKLKRSNVRDNRGPAGGAILTDATATLILNASTLTGNHGTSMAGGVENKAGGTVLLWKEPTISDNTAGQSATPGFPDCINLGETCSGS